MSLDAYLISFAGLPSAYYAISVAEGGLTIFETKRFINKHAVTLNCDQRHRLATSRVILRNPMFAREVATSFQKDLFVGALV